MKLCQLFCWHVIPVSTEREQTLELNACVRTVTPKKVDENQDTSAVSSNYWWQFFLVVRLIKDKADASSTVNQSVIGNVSCLYGAETRSKMYLWSVFRAKYLKGRNRVWRSLPVVCLLCFCHFSELLEAVWGDFLFNGRCDIMPK